MSDTVEFNEIPKIYNPSSVEDKWYSYWQEKNLFHSDIDKNKTPYTIVIPPPNITGFLHMGHILNNTLQDIFIRTKRMQGFNACWVPGTDHASIATETKVVNMLKEKGIDKYNIGREEFLKYCWEWKEKYGGIIIQQLKKLGVSCDWDRLRFTMDDDFYKKVIETFVSLFKEGKIYRGYRMVNWDPASRSAISDEEVNFRTVNGKLWHLRYRISGEDTHIIVATTRPETMLGDTGIAVNPNDERYKRLIGKTVILPIVEREIPVFADDYVDMEFGTGAVKVTPAHDVNDYDMGIRHNLELINIFNDNASLNHNVPEEFRGLDRFEARKVIVARLEEAGLIEKIEDYQNKVGYSERGGVPIEPYLSEQWFMKMNELASPALKVVKDGEISFYPEHWVKTYEHWMENIKDWCISRQLWWGHRIPVWYHKETREIYCDVNPPADIEKWVQDEDVLDTWASSWLWAYDVFKTDEEQKYYYPTDTLVTGPDIIFFWVARMIMAGLHFKKDIPFKNVYFTSILRDLQGRKMSKSLGNSPDPLDVISSYGADALRFTVIYLAPLGQDVIFSEEKCEIGRNFANKIWNAGRFLLMNAQNVKRNESLLNAHKDFTDEWIISRFNLTLKQLNRAMEKFEVNNASKIIYSFVWNDFCDWYIELAKNRLYADNEEIKSAVLIRSLKMFENLLKIVHPFMPFITEELWAILGNQEIQGSISLSVYPQLEESSINRKIEKEMIFIKTIIYQIRRIISDLNITISKKIHVILKTKNIPEIELEYIKKLTKVENISINEKYQRTAFTAFGVVKNCEIYIPLQELIDIPSEINRNQREIDRLKKMYDSVNRKLDNVDFIANAPNAIIDKEKEKKNYASESLSKLLHNFIYFINDETELRETLYLIYMLDYYEQFESFLVEFEKSSSIDNAIEKATKKELTPRYFYLKAQTLSAMEARLLANKNLLSMQNNFDDLYNIIYTLREKFLGNVACYRLALKIGFYLRLKPDYIYVTSPILYDIRGLNQVIQNEKIPLNNVYGPLNSLPLYHLENFLYVFRNELKILSQNVVFKLR